MPGVLGRFARRQGAGKGVTYKVIENRFPIKGVAMKNGMRMIIAKLAADGQAVAQTNAPIDTGFLRANILSSFETTGVLGGVFVGSVFTNVEYAVYQEFGTRFMPPHPFFGPAYFAMERAAHQVMPGLARMIERA